jgi:predicted ArsR family transcriptional regulator
MPRSEISEEVLDFVARRIDSVPHLEALLLFAEKPDVMWTASEIAARVYVSRDKARTILQDLARNGFITGAAGNADGYRYHAEWDEGQLMVKVAEAYRKHLVDVASLIHAKAGSRSVEEFARAFKFKNKE